MTLSIHVCIIYIICEVLITLNFRVKSKKILFLIFYCSPKKVAWKWKPRLWASGVRLRAGGPCPASLLLLRRRPLRRRPTCVPRPSAALGSAIVAPSRPRPGENFRAAGGSLHYSSTWRTGLVLGRQQTLQTKQFTLIQQNTGQRGASQPLILFRQGRVITLRLLSVWKPGF